jgi:hypothetical protein
MSGASSHAPAIGFFISQDLHNNLAGSYHFNIKTEVLTGRKTSVFQIKPSKNHRQNPAFESWQ